jgi:hypothetical protein
MLVAGASALVVLAGAGTAVALAGGGKPDALQVADPTPTTPGAVVAPAAYLPTPEDATRATGGTWQAGSVYTDQGFLFWICPQGEGFSEAGVGRRLARGDDSVATFASVLPSGEPARWLGTFRQAAVDCPRTLADSEDGKASNSYEVLSGVTPGRLVLRDTYRDCDTCPGSVTLWLVLASDGVLTTNQLPGDQESRLGSWVEVLLERLANPVADPPTPAPTPTRSSLEPVTDAPLSEADLLEFGQIGPVVVGMTLDEARAAAQVELKQEGDDLGGCVFYAPGYGGPDVSFMVVRGVVSRIDVDSGTTTTNLGVGLGATEADVKRSYPTVVVSKHHYTNGHYLRVLSDDGRLALLFETDGTKVTSFRGGFPDAVDAPEGCA